MKRRVTRVVAFHIDEKKLKALRHAGRVEGDRIPVAAQIREAIDGYLDRLAGKRPSGKWESRQEGLSLRVGRGKTPPRIMLHLGDRARLKLLRLQSKTLKGTHRTVGRVIRAAIDEYLEAHGEELRQLLREKRLKLGNEWFLTWKRQVERGPSGEERPSRTQR